MTDDERKAWLAERRTGIGSSDAAAAIGYRPKHGRIFKTALAVYLDKIGLLSDSDNRQKKWGRRLEDTVAEAYAEETGRTVERPAKALFRHPLLPWMLASPDRLSVGDGDVGGLECKTAGAHETDAWGVPWTDEIPDLYIFQVQHQMAVMGWSWVHVPVLFGVNDFRIYEVQYDVRFGARLAALEHDFWKAVEARQPPAPDWTHPETPKLLELLHRPRVGKIVRLAGDPLEELRIYEELRELIGTYDKRADQAKARVIEAMGEAEFGLLPDGRRVRRRLQTRAAHPVKETQFYDFRILKAKGETDGERGDEG